MIKKVSTLASCLMLIIGWSAASIAQASDDLRLQVEETERAFAKTMADRDFDAFVSFLADEAVFFSGPTALRGKQQVSDAWKSLYENPEAPFSWVPEQVVVLESGTLALSTGPVLNADGNPIASFTSIWRLEKNGEWKVIFDKGCEVCDCSKP
jgi:ketosteroid isomerase-like protein